MSMMPPLGNLLRVEENIFLAIINDSIELVIDSINNLHRTIDIVA